MTSHAVSEDYYAEHFNREWSKGVTDQARVVKAAVTLRKGYNEFCIYAGEPGVIVEKTVLHPADRPLPESLLGPEASCKYTS